MKYQALIKKALRLADKSVVSSEEERREVIDELNSALQDEDTPKWWVVVLKVLAYAIGLILAGYGTSLAVTMLIPSIL